MQSHSEEALSRDQPGELAAPIQALLVRAGAAQLAIPLLSIRESIRCEPDALTRLGDGRLSVRLRRELFCVISLRQLFGQTLQPPSEREVLVIVGSDDRHVALRVDEVLGQFDCVPTHPAGQVSMPRGVSAFTLLDEGVGLVVDVPGLVALAAQPTH